MSVSISVDLASRPSAGYGAFSARPAAGQQGVQYFASDSPIAHWVHTGTAWAPIIGGQVVGVQPPAAAGFTGMNEGGSLLADDNGSLLLTGVDDGSGAGGTLRGFTLPLVGAAAHVECCPQGVADALVTASRWEVFVLGMREGGTGKVFGISLFNIHSTSQAWAIETDIWTSTTARTGTSTSINMIGTGPFIYRVRRNGSNTLAEVSRDRRTWLTFATVVTTSAFTTAPDQLFIGALGIGVTPKFSLLHLHYGT